MEARRTAQGRASVTERGVGDGGQILTTLVALAVAAIRCRLKQITEGIALQPLSFYYSLIPIICSPMTAKKIFDVTDVEVLSTGIYTRRASNKISPTLYTRVARRLRVDDIAPRRTDSSEIEEYAAGASPSRAPRARTRHERDENFIDGLFRGAPERHTNRPTKSDVDFIAQPDDFPAKILPLDSRKRSQLSLNSVELARARVSGCITKTYTWHRYIWIKIRASSEQGEERRGEEGREEKRSKKTSTKRKRNRFNIFKANIGIQRSRLLSGFTKRADLPPTN